MPETTNRPVAIWPEGTPKPLMPYSPAVKAGRWLFVSGHLASDYKAGGLAPEAAPANPNLGNKLELESRYVLANMEETVRAAGLDMSRDVVRIWQWLTSDYPTKDEFRAGNTWPRIETITPYLDVRNQYIREPRPASTALGMKELLVRDTTLEVDMILMEGGESVGYPVPDGVPSPLAGYSPALRRGDWVFLAGDTPADWKGDYGACAHMGEVGGVAPEARLKPYFWYGSTIEKHTDYTLSKLARIAEAAGTSLARAVKADVYIGDPGDFAGMDKVWRKWFSDNPPARCVIPYMGIGGGKGGRIEIALTLLANDSTLAMETIHTDKAPKPFGHEPQAVKAGDLLFFSGQMACDENGLVPEGLVRTAAYPYYGQSGRLQMRYMLKNVAAVCEAAGTSLENVVRRVCFHDDGQWFAEAVDEWAAHFPGVKPCSTTMVIGGPLVAPGANTLLDLIAYVPV